MLHALFLLAFMLVAAPLAAYVPLAALAGVLVVVAWNMAEKRGDRPPAARLADRGVLLATFGLTVVRDLTAGIVAGCALSALLWVASELARSRA